MHGGRKVQRAGVRGRRRGLPGDRRRGLLRDLNARGARLAEGLVAAAGAAGIEACWSGVGAMFQLWFSPAPPGDYREANAIVAGSPFFALYPELRAHGVLIQPPQEGLWLMSGAHTDADIDQTLAAAADAMQAVAAAVAGETGSRREASDEPFHPAGWPGAGRRRLRRAVRPGRSSSGKPVSGGILRAGIPDNPDHLDPALSYTNEGWEILEANNNGLLTFKKAAGGPGDESCRTSPARCRRSAPTAAPTPSTCAGRDVRGAGQPRGEAVRLQVHDRAAVPRRLRRRRVLHRDRRGEQYAKTSKGGSRASSRTTRR